MPRPFTRLPEPWAFVRHFTPNWFAMTMGTGVLALVIANLPWAFAGRDDLAFALWLINALLFVTFSLLVAARCLLCQQPALQVALVAPVADEHDGALRHQPVV